MEFTEEFVDWLGTDEGQEALRDSAMQGKPLILFSFDTPLEGALKRLSVAEGVLVIWEEGEFTLLDYELLGRYLPAEKDSNPHLAIGKFIGSIEGMKFYDSGKYKGETMYPVSFKDSISAALTVKDEDGVLAIYDGVGGTFSFLKISLKDLGQEEE